VYLDIETSCEGALAGAGEDDGADVGVVGEFAEDGGEVEPHPEMDSMVSLSLSLIWGALLSLRR
jgi:hypothetical protein